MWERITKNGRLVVQDAMEEAQRLGSPIVLPEHLLLSFTRDDVERNRDNHYLLQPVGTVVLERLGISLAALRAELLSYLPADSANEVTQVLLSPALQEVLHQGFQEADEVGNRYVGSEHLLLALLRDEQSVSAQSLSRFGIGWSQVQKEVLRMQR